MLRKYVQISFNLLPCHKICLDLFSGQFSRVISESVIVGYSVKVIKSRAGLALLSGVALNLRSADCSDQVSKKKGETQFRSALKTVSELRDLYPPPIHTVTRSSWVEGEVCVDRSESEKARAPEVTGLRWLTMLMLLLMTLL